MATGSRTQAPRGPSSTRAVAARTRWVAVLVAVLAAGAVVVPSEAIYADSGITLLSLDSDYGDYVGAGRQHSFSAGDGEFGVTYEDGVLTAEFDGGGQDHWTMRFSPPEGRVLEPGPYESAIRFTPQPTIRSELSVTGMGRGCNRYLSRFDVLELALAPDGTVERFAADFEQHCDEEPPALRGSIRVNASATFAPTPDDDGDEVPNTVDTCRGIANPTQADADRDGLGDACDATFDNTYLAFDSDRGDRFGDGIDRTWYPVDGAFSATHLADRVTVRFEGGADYWTLDFKAPEGRALEPGSYDGASHFPSQPPTSPGLSVGGSGPDPGPGCNDFTGRFDILELVRAPDGIVERFAADFELHCLGQPPALRGGIRVDTSLPVAPPPDDDSDGLTNTSDNCPSIHNRIQGDADQDGAGDACDIGPEPLTDHIEPLCAAVPAGTDPFVDDDRSTFEAMIECLAYAGVTSGGPAGLPADRYGPTLVVSRGQMATFIARAADAASRLATPTGVNRLAAFDGVDDFSDVGTSVHRQAIGRLAQAGIAFGGPGGRASTQFAPELLVTRGQMASFLDRSLELLIDSPLTSDRDHFSDDEADPHEPAINRIASAGLTVGNGAGGYGPGQEISRGQMAAFLVRQLAVLLDLSRIAPLS